MNYLLIGIIMILALFAIRFSHKHGIPALLLFILLGMSFGVLGLSLITMRSPTTLHRSL